MQGEKYTDEEMQQRYASTDDKRAKENNVMRHEYRTLSDDEKQRIAEMKNLGLKFIELCDGCGQGRELSLAKTKMEEAVMWAVKAVTA